MERDIFEEEGCSSRESEQLRTYRPSSPTAISYGLIPSFILTVPTTLQSVSNIFTRSLSATYGWF